MNVSSSACALYVACLLIGLWPTPGWSHALHHDVIKEGGAVTVSFQFQGSERPWFEPYEVHAPETERPFQVGRINQLGEVSFRPNRPGIWEVTVTTEDGHRDRARIEVSDDGTVTALSAAGSVTTKMIPGVGYVLGIFGAFALWRMKRMRQNIAKTSCTSPTA